VHSVEEFCKKALDVVVLDWQKYIRIDTKVKFSELINIMVREDLNRWKGWLNGERFYWDEINYPNESKIITRSLRI